VASLAKFTLLLVALLVTAACLPSPVAAQFAEAEQDTVYRITLVDGSTLFGRIVESSEARIVVRTQAGARVEIERSQIRDMRPASGRVVNGQIWQEDANDTRLFFAPTGRAVGHGKGYIGLYELFFSFVAVGVGDHVTLAGGTPIVPGAIGEAFYLAPKITFINAARFHLAAGALSFFLTDAVDEGSVGVAYGVATWGSSDNAVTVGAGWGFALTSDGSAIADEPVLMVGFEKRTSRGLKLISENYYASGVALLSGGVRFLGERFSADIGLGGAFSSDDSFFGLPILNVAWRF
jgi:hypothetical protein